MQIESYIVPYRSLGAVAGAGTIPVVAIRTFRGVVGFQTAQHIITFITAAIQTCVFPTPRAVLSATTRYQYHPGDINDYEDSSE